MVGAALAWGEATSTTDLAMIQFASRAFELALVTLMFTAFT
jgi:hypothetical protein